MNAHELKALRSRLSSAQAELAASEQITKDLQSKASNSQRQTADWRSKVQQLAAQIEEATAIAPEPIVTEHAMLRFLERVYGIDLNQIKETILTQGLVMAVNQFKSGKFPIEGYECRAVVKDRTIITIEN